MNGPCLLTRPGCDLCDEFHAEWRAAFPGIELPCLNVDRDPALRQRFGGTIPVLLDESDREVCRVCFDRLACEPLAVRMGCDS